MRVPRIKNAVKSILDSIGGIKAARRFLSCRCEGFATMFLLHRAAGVYTGFKLLLGCYDNLKRVNAEQIERFVFVCRGNVCRSPYAESVAKSYGLTAISCGVDVSRSCPAEATALRAALLRGKDLSLHMSLSIFDVTLKSSDCLVAMDPSHVPTIRNIAASIGCQVTLIGLWREPPVTEIADPYGGTIRAFNQCFDEIDQALSGLVGNLAVVK